MLSLVEYLKEDTQQINSAKIKRMLCKKYTQFPFSLIQYTGLLCSFEFWTGLVFSGGFTDCDGLIGNYIER